MCIYWLTSLYYGLELADNHQLLLFGFGQKACQLLFCFFHLLFCLFQLRIFLLQLCILVFGGKDLSSRARSLGPLTLAASSSILHCFSRYSCCCRPWRNLRNSVSTWDARFHTRCMSLCVFRSSIPTSLLTIPTHVRRVWVSCTGGTFPCDLTQIVKDSPILERM